MSEDIIEQIARAIYEEISDNFNLFDLDYATPPTWEQISEGARAMFRDVAGSTCAMVRRATLEEAAKVAEGQKFSQYADNYRTENVDDMDSKNWTVDSQYGSGRADAAAAIRKLKGEA